MVATAAVRRVLVSGCGVGLAALAGCGPDPAPTAGSTGNPTGPNSAVSTSPTASATASNLPDACVLFPQAEVSQLVGRGAMNPGDQNNLASNVCGWTSGPFEAEFDYFTSRQLFSQDIVKGFDDEVSDLHSISPDGTVTTITGLGDRATQVRYGGASHTLVLVVLKGQLMCKITVTRGVDDAGDSAPLALNLAQLVLKKLP
jgi:hypothetical protein